MGLIDTINGFFADDNISTMNTGAEDLIVLRGAPVADRSGYEDFEYPYTPMQRSKRYPKIINAYALKERANGDIALFRDHKTLLDEHEAEITDLQDRVSAIESQDTANNSYIMGLVYLGKHSGYYDNSNTLTTRNFYRAPIAWGTGTFTVEYGVWFNIVTNRFCAWQIPGTIATFIPQMFHKVYIQGMDTNNQFRGYSVPLIKTIPTDTASYTVQGQFTGGQQTSPIRNYIVWADMS